MEAVGQKRAFAIDLDRVKRATAMLMPLGPRDQFRIGDVWDFAANDWQHLRSVDEVNHYGMRRSVVGDTLTISTLDQPDALAVQIVGIRMVDFDRLVAADIADLGFEDASEFTAEWGNGTGQRGWMFTVQPPTPTITPEEMAAMHDVAAATIKRHLRADQALPLSERSIPGAFKVGEGKQGTWKIPLDVAQAWKPNAFGRPRADRE